MKRSDVVVLAILGATYSYAIFHHDRVYRDEYGSREDCERDWGGNGRCEQSGSGSGGGYGGSGGRYYGPSYEEDARPDTNRPGLAQGRSMIARGGFGHSGAAFSRGG